ncbi:DUF421 domain-containing protein [Alcaligenaceae bacterium]|nr:DUF421 domain-containing protein [Alcaligenaceae bacterium]
MVPFDWQRFFLDDLPLLFLAEVAVRAFAGYALVFLFLKASGRRGVRQLSVFELVVILTLGSAAGDVVYYEDSPVLPAAAVFISILLLYRATTYAMQHSHRFNNWVEGKPVTLIRDGLYEIDSFKDMNITDDEFFMELRQQGVEHLGQVRLAILEVDGNISLFFHENNAVRAGLSVLPPEYRDTRKNVSADGLYACSRCGHTETLAAQQGATCPRCQNTLWSKTLTTHRHN